MHNHPDKVQFLVSERISHAWREADHGRLLRSLDDTRKAQDRRHPVWLSLASLRSLVSTGSDQSVPGPEADLSVVR
jgi:hypothetical protein